ncbi:esterase/lipase family protein [Bradyrhizobium erythrophlei]|uniref:esterase/lipase family protein n=1 Tax=Bradyrhizobium erythrophlei TaxID=1437360 RepID=UPI0035ECE9D1
MAQDTSDDVERFQAHIDAADEKRDLFKDLYKEFDDRKDSAAGLRRARRRASNTTDATIKTVSLVQKDGVLYWCDDIPADEPKDLGMGLSQRRRRRRAGLTVPDKDDPKMEPSLVLTKTFPAIEPNQIVKAVGRIDTALNPAINDTLRSRLRPLRLRSDGTFALDVAEAMGRFTGRTLLMVHGTFSNAVNMLTEFEATPDGHAFLVEAMSGNKKYDRVLFFDHATLAVSPVLNALELGRAFARASGQIDVIAHSRGGLVVRWWLEAFGKTLDVDAHTPVRAVLVGSPLNGTSLAAPDRLQGALSLLSNIGTFAEVTLKLTGAANPFLWVTGKLVEVVVSATGLLARTPLVDGLVALVPGLSGQSKVSNNHEIDRLRLGPCVVGPAYYAVKSNFEAKDPGWKFWEYFRAKNLADTTTNAIFPKDDSNNDLVVNTSSMDDFGVPLLGLAAPARDFGTSDKIWHCNYFRQPDTIADIRKKWLI